MTRKSKTLLVLSGAVLLSIPSLWAQGHGSGGGARGGSFAGRPLANNALNGTRGYRGGSFGRGSYSRGGYGHGYGRGYGRYYYLGGIPYFYPFYGYGFGYGGFYGDGFYGGYGDGFYGGYGDGGYGEGGYGDAGAGYGNGNGAYEGRITNNNRGGQVQQGEGQSLPSAVQRQLFKRGYYKGTVDGQFGPGSRDALRRFQKSQGLKATGNIDEDSLDALGFTDKR